jgi:hypothetical protein
VQEGRTRAQNNAQCTPSRRTRQSVSIPQRYYCNRKVRPHDPKRPLVGSTVSLSLQVDVELDLWLQAQDRVLAVLAHYL